MTVFQLHLLWGCSAIALITLASLVAKYQADFLVIGGGIIGISIGRQLKMLYPEMAVSLLEKEAAVGFHASGRNSGVFHVGFFTPSIV